MRPITIRIKKKKLRAMKLILVGIMLLTAVLFLGSRVRPLIETIAAYQAQLLATRSINDAVIEVISEEDIVYNSIINISESSDGSITSISTDMITMNRLKSEITNRVTDYLQREADNTIYIPIGTLLGNELFSGRGPDVAFKVLPTGSIHSEIYNSFEEAGINQTLHQIMLSVRVDVSAVMPLYSVSTSVTTNICIAETVIVGKVPGNYTKINGDDSGMIDKFNNYHPDGDGTGQNELE